MKKKVTPGLESDALRSQAETRNDHLRHDEVDLPKTEENALKLVHELQVHQIELEIQNDELQQSRLYVEDSLERYTDLYDFAPVGYFSLLRNGTIIQANLTGASLLGVERLNLVGRRMGQFIQTDDRLVFSAFLERVFGGQTKEACVVAVGKNGFGPIWVQIEGVLVDNRKNCRLVVMDINARKQAEIQLHAAEAELERLLASSEESRRVLLRVVEDKKKVEDQILLINSGLERRVNERTLEIRETVAQLKESEAEVQALYRISKELNSTLDVDSILDMLTREAIRIVDGESGFAGLRTPEGMKTRKYFQEDQSFPFEYIWPIGEGIPGWVLQYKVPYGTSDVKNDPLIQDQLEINTHIRSLICTPILDSSGEVLGFFDIRNKKIESGFTIKDQEMLMALAPAASIAIQNAIAYQQRLLAEVELKNFSEQLQALAANLESIREEERTEIARELHDQLGQALTAMKFDLASMSERLGHKDVELAQKAKAITSQMDTMIKTVRRIATELRPGMLDDLGLAASIEWQAHDFEKRTGIGCNLNLIAEDLALTRTQSITMFRIFQESLTNIARHAHAKHVQVALTATSEKLTLQIQDDGRGIRSNEISGLHSLGLLGMRERATRLGGSFVIQGSPKSGTLVTASFPIK